MKPSDMDHIKSSAAQAVAQGMSMLDYFLCIEHAHTFEQISEAVNLYGEMNRDEWQEQE